MKGALPKNIAASILQCAKCINFRDDDRIFSIATLTGRNLQDYATSTAIVDSNIKY